PALLHATRLRPNEPFPLLYLGEVFSATKRINQAVQVLQKYIALMPSPDLAPRDVSRAYYLLGQAFRRLGPNDDAEKALANSQRYREAKFRYDVQHIFDEPAKSTDGESRNSDRVASLLESGQVDDTKNSQTLIQGEVREMVAGHAPAAQQRPET